MNSAFEYQLFRITEQETVKISFSWKMYAVCDTVKRSNFQTLNVMTDKQIVFTIYRMHVETKEMLNCYSRKKKKKNWKNISNHIFILNFRKISNDYSIDFTENDGRS